MVLLSGTASGDPSSMKGCQVASVPLPRALLRTLGQRPVRCLGERCPPVLARTDACARPDPSRGIRPRPLLPGLCRLRSAPAGRWSFPTLLPKSFPACLDPYPGCPWGALSRFFPQGYGLPQDKSGSALRIIDQATSRPNNFRGCSHSSLFRPAGLLATQIAPTAS